MISKILCALKDFLDYSLDPEILVDLDSVKKDTSTVSQDIIITLLRIEEETSRKSQNSYTQLKNGNLKAVAPSVNINLEILISSRARQYESAIKQISMVMSLVNSVQTAPKPEQLSEETMQLIRSMSISMMPLTFEQHLSLWQTLGGDMLPSVAYKIRMLTIEGINDDQTKIPIKTVNILTDRKDEIYTPIEDSEK